MKKTKNKEDLIAELNAIKLDLEAASWKDVSFKDIIAIDDQECNFTMVLGDRNLNGHIFYSGKKLQKSFEIYGRIIPVATNSNKFIMKLGVVLGDITHGR